MNDDEHKNEHQHALENGIKSEIKADADDFIEYADDEAPRPSARNESAWRVLVVDDDQEVHDATGFALRNTSILGRPLTLLHAYSAREAREVLQREPDLAVVLLDVVMESEDAGLGLVKVIRQELGMSAVRVILRTGQPGYAPELQVIRDYDINDYKTKSELTHTRLITFLTAAIRSYQQIHTINQNRRGLELIIGAVADLMERSALSSFAEGVLTQMTALLDLPLNAIVCAQKGSPFNNAEPDRLYVIGAAGRLAYAISQPLETLREPDVVAAIDACLSAREHRFGLDYTVLFLRSSNQEAAVYIHAGAALTESDRRLLEVFAANITACFGNLRLVERLNFVAYHDALTGLANRSGFLLELDSATSPSETVALVDVDHFTDTNDGLGHEVGNQLLCALAQRLRRELSPACRVARVGSDLFGVIGPGSEVCPERLFPIFDAPFWAGEHLLPVTVTLGLEQVPEGGVSGSVLLRQTNIALNQAKKNLYARHHYFTQDMEDDTRQRLDVIRLLRQDFRAGQLAVWFQPQVSLVDGQVRGMEALLRWPGGHASGSGFVATPSVFIPLAEYSGLYVDIGDWVLDQACDAFKTLRQLPGAPQRVSVNVSMPQFRIAGFVERVVAILDSHGLPPTALELEVTESIAMDEPKVVMSSLQALRQMGVRVAMDDFGTGYSSLGQLQALPIDCLKIDRVFVCEIGSKHPTGKQGMFAETIVALGRKLGMEIVAEGVETEEQARFLADLGCDLAQGFLYATPMPATELTRWLAQRQKTEN